MNPKHRSWLAISRETDNRHPLLVPKSGIYSPLNRKASTYDHRVWKTGLPVRSAVLKPHAGRLVVGWVTTSESRLLYVFLCERSEHLHKAKGGRYSLFLRMNTHKLCPGACHRSDHCWQWCLNQSFQTCRRYLFPCLQRLLSPCLWYIPW